MIAIRLVSYAGEAPATALEATFDAAGGDIGRGADCTLVLPDPERRISRKHLQVASRSGSYFLRLISTNLLVELDGVPLAPGVECALAPGAQIRIGPFLLRAEGHAALAAPSPAPAPAPAPAQTLALFERAGPASRPSVFRDLLHASPAQARPHARADDAERPGPVEIDLLVGDPTGSDGGAEPPATPAPQPPAAVADDDLIAALYTGLGLPTPELASRSAAQVELIGALLRQCVIGTVELLAARSIARRELGASPTLIQTRQNNPLKFSAEPQAALAQLLTPTRRGFVPPVTAVREAFDDLRAHEVAVLAGMRAALASVIDRLSPATLELGLADKGLWDNLLPVNHKARMWERYSEQHADLAHEIEDNVDAHFAGAFIEAYEAQLGRLQRE